jgi:beta-lactam-binding protein with PASTA domain
VKLRATVIVWAVVAVILAGCGATVPDVVGMSLSQAYDTLEAAGFEVDTPAYHEDSTVAPGTVIAQDPEGGSRADEGLAVSLVVAGPPPVETPDLEGLDLGESIAGGWSTMPSNPSAGDRYADRGHGRRSLRYR